MHANMSRVVLKQVSGCLKHPTSALRPRSSSCPPRRRRPTDKQGIEHACLGDVVILRAKAVNAQHCGPGLGFCGKAQNSHRGLRPRSCAQRILERSANLSEGLLRQGAPDKTPEASPMTSARTPPVGFVSATMRPRRNAQIRSSGTAACVSPTAALLRPRGACRKLSVQQPFRVRSLGNSCQHFNPASASAGTTFFLLALSCSQRRIRVAYGPSRLGTGGAASCSTSSSVGSCAPGMAPATSGVPRNVACLTSDEARRLCIPTPSRLTGNALPSHGQGRKAAEARVGRVGNALAPLGNRDGWEWQRRDAGAAKAVL